MRNFGKIVMFVTAVSCSYPSASRKKQLKEAQPTLPEAPEVISNPYPDPVAYQPLDQEIPSQVNEPTDDELKKKRLWFQS